MCRMKQDYQIRWRLHGTKNHREAHGEQQSSNWCMIWEFITVHAMLYHTLLTSELMTSSLVLKTRERDKNAAQTINMMIALFGKKQLRIRTWVMSDRAWRKTTWWSCLTEHAVKQCCQHFIKCEEHLSVKTLTMSLSLIRSWKRRIR